MRRAAIVTGLLLAAAVVATMLVLARGDEWLRAALERELQRHVVPELRIGALDWRIRPVPRVSVRALSLRDADGFVSLEIRELVAELEPGALAERRLAVDTVTIDGLTLNLRRRDDGRWNVTEWLRAGEKGAGRGAAVPLRRLRLTDAAVRMDGAWAGALEQLRLEAGPFVPGAPAMLDAHGRLTTTAPHAAALSLALAGTLRIDDAGVAFESLELASEGSFEAWSVTRAGARAGRLGFATDGALDAGELELELDAAAPAASIGLHATVATLAGDQRGWRAGTVVAQAQGDHDGRRAHARLGASAVTLAAGQWRVAAAELGLELAGEGPAVQLELAGEGSGSHARGMARAALEEARGRIALPHPAGSAEPLEVLFTGDARIADGVAEGNLAGSFDASRFDGQWRFEAGIQPPLAFGLALDRLDLDRYTPPAGATARDTDLAAWRNWPVSADLSVDELRIQGFVSRNARLKLVGEGRLGADRPLDAPPGR